MRKFFAVLVMIMVYVAWIYPTNAFAAMSDEDFVELCRNGSLQQINDAIKNGANVNAGAGGEGNYHTPLSIAAQSNPNPEVITALVKAGADVNRELLNAGLIFTPLMYAAQSNPNPEVITALVKVGADVDVWTGGSSGPDSGSGYTPLTRAAIFNSNPEVIAVLVKAGADVNARDKNGETVLMDAANFSSNPEVITVLLKAGLDVNAKNNNGATSLMKAAGNFNPEMVKILIEHGADTKIKDNSGETALDKARKYSNIDALRILESALSTTGSKSTSAPNQLIGTWVTNFQGNESEATYRRDGTFSSRTGGLTVDGTYSVSGNRLTEIVPSLGITSISEISIKDNVLTLKAVRSEINGVDVTSTVQGATFTYKRK